MNHAVICGGTRIPFSRAGTAYQDVGNQEMMTFVLQALTDKLHLNGKRLGDVSLGAVMAHSKDWNFARECVLGTSLAPETPAHNLQRACGTSLEATIQIANKIRLGQIESGIAAGYDSMSDVPISYSRKFASTLIKSSRGKSIIDKIRPWVDIRPSDVKPVFPAVVEPRTGLSMGESCELMAKTWQITQEEQDILALASHKNAAAAWKNNFYSDLVSPFQGAKFDNNVRENTTLEKLRTLKPVFDRSKAGTLTAGNSSPLTDGAAAVFLASREYAQKNSLPILAKFVDAEVAAVNFVDKSEGLLMAPAYAVARMLQRNNLKLQDFDFYEIHEAFAAQVLCTLKAWESEEYCKSRLGCSTALGSIDRSKLNIHGSSIAIGHPFGATGARIVATLAKTISQKQNSRGLISICTGGGMGVVAILESV
ncbi:MAG: acetyl-CoA C-acetyltransferase [Oligoflexia bacterium]|nr:acetyl-CoA C-acetyltransferase [Oligoflexia bacterium]